MSETNANERPMESKRHFDFAAFDSEITKELKEHSMFYDPEIDDRPRNPGVIGSVIAEATGLPRHPFDVV